MTRTSFKFIRLFLTKKIYINQGTEIRNPIIIPEKAHKPHAKRVWWNGPGFSVYSALWYWYNVYWKMIFGFLDRICTIWIDIFSFLLVRPEPKAFISWLFNLNIIPQAFNHFKSSLDTLNGFNSVPDWLDLPKCTKLPSWNADKRTGVWNAICHSPKYFRTIAYKDFPQKSY